MRRCFTNTRRRRPCCARPCGCRSKPNPARTPSTPTLASSCSAKSSKCLAAKPLMGSARAKSSRRWASRLRAFVRLRKSDPRFPPPKTTRRFAAASSRAKCRTKTVSSSAESLATQGCSPTSRTCCTSPQCILAQGRTQQGSQLFQPATVAQFATRQGPLESKSRALGWDVPTEGSSSGRYFGLRSIGHLGYSGCSLWIDPDQELAVVAAHQPHLARPLQRRDPPGPAGVSRCRRRIPARLIRVRVKT